VTGVERFHIVEEAGRTAVYLAGEFDLANRDELRRCLAALRGRVVADLADVSFLDSSTIGVLIGTQNRLSAAGGELRLRNPQALPRRALETVGLGPWIDEDK
jgi:anti-anti-sigma factor